MMQLFEYKDERFTFKQYEQLVRVMHDLAIDYQYLDFYGEIIPVYCHSLQDIRKVKDHVEVGKIVFARAD